MNLYRGRASSGGSPSPWVEVTKRMMFFVGQGFAFEIACAAEVGFYAGGLKFGV